MFFPSFALVSIYAILRFSDIWLASYFDTTLLRSHLFPISKVTQEGSPYYKIASYQVSIASHDSLLVTSYTNKAPAAYL
jgi:hypothetical protein